MSEPAPTVLARIVAHTRAQLERRKRERPQRELERRLGAAGDASLQAGRLRAALGSPGLAVIAEFKRRSPSAGRLREHADVKEMALAYERAGASALSVLTEEEHFGGSLADLRAARAASSLPVLRKDFIVDPYQLYEAREAGADAVLLIVAALEQPELASLQRRALELGLDALVEVHDGAELRTALDVGAQIIGINNRDLRDLSVDVSRTSRLIGEIPEEVLCVSESGIAGAAQLRALAREGLDAVLIGEALMRARDPAHALGELLAAASEVDQVPGRARAAR